MQAPDATTKPDAPRPRAALQHFGSSGIRGPLARVHPELALRLGRALAVDHPSVIVGTDARLTGPQLQAALVAGLLAGGADVTQVGLLPTPALARLARGHDLGVQVTASHNPAPDNGFKLWTPAGASPEADALALIEAHMGSLPEAAGWSGVGRLVERCDGLERYHTDVLRQVRAHGNTVRPLAGLRIALDCAHGAGAVSTPRLLSALGAELTLVGGHADGRFPDHPSEPDAAHLARFSRIVANEDDHVLGIAHDGDADRTVFLHPDGRVIPGERVLAVLAAARGDTAIALPVDGSGVVQDHLPEADVTITPVGDIHLSRALVQGKATIGCEPSGTWFFHDWAPTPEGPYAACFVAAFLAAQPDLLERIDALPTYARVTHKMRLPEGAAQQEAQRVVTDAGASLREMLQPHDVSAVDGMRIETDDGWVLVRPSGTEPLVRVTAEAKGDGRATQLAETARRMVGEAMDHIDTGGAA